jgi:AraC-like DNA-binding protein
MASGLSQGLNRTREDMKPADLDLFSRAQALIESKLGDETLSVATLLGPLRTSRGALYSGFASYGGVSAYIRERRLQRCYEIIKIGGRSNETIGTIAFSLGFRSEAHFSRAFKDRFGLTPRSLRLAARSHGANVAPSTATGVPPEAIQSLGR